MNVHRQRARLLLSQDRFAQAEQEWRAVLAEEPDDAEAHASLALCLMEREDFDAAEAEAKLAIGAEPEDGFVHYVLARVLQERKRYAEAAQAIAEAIRCDPDQPDFRGVLASIHSAQAHWTESLAAANAGLAIDPTHLGCANMRALALRQLGRQDEAAATIQGVMQRSPNSSMTHANQGWTLLHAGDHRAAMEHFRESLRLQPDNEWAREGLLTALKARNPLFRLMLAFFLFMSRKSGGSRTAIVIGIYIGQNILRQMAEAHPEYGWILWPLLYCVVGFVYLTWLANPLMNLVIRLHPLGRHALTADQRAQSLLCGAALLAGLVNLGVAWAISGSVNALCLPLFLLAMPLTTIHDMERGWPRWLAVGVSAVFIAVALEIALTGQLAGVVDPPHGRGPFSPWWHDANVLAHIAVKVMWPFFIGILAWSFVAPMLSRVQPTR